MKITISIKYLYEDDRKVTGAIFTSDSVPQNSTELMEMESIMKHHALDKIFPNTGLTFFSLTRFPIVSFIVLTNINDMKERKEEIDYTLHFQSHIYQ